jgi:predicted  nucleic acid-binding Zn-ribbon protein
MRNHFSSFGHTWFHKNYTCWNKHGEEGLNKLKAGCLNEGEVRHCATNRDEDLDDSGVFEENEPLFPPIDQEVRGFDDGEVLQRVHNVNQMLRDVEFQRVYTPSELARLKQFIEDSKKPLYPDCQKYSHLSGDLKLMHLKADHGWSNKSFKHLLDVLRDMLPKGNQIEESIYEVKKIICPMVIEIEKIHACKNSCVLFFGDYADLVKCPKCGYDRYKRKKDDGDDNNTDDENEPGEIRGKKKENLGTP